MHFYLCIGPKVSMDISTVLFSYKIMHSSSIEISQNSSLRARLAKYTPNANGKSFGLHHFTYNNPEFHEVMFSKLHTLRFEGIVVCD